MELPGQARRMPKWTVVDGNEPMCCPIYLRLAQLATTATAGTANNVGARPKGDNVVANLMLITVIFKLSQFEIVSS